MYFRLIILFLTLLVTESILGQITTAPTLPFATQKVTITFDSSKEDRLGYFTGELFAHTGVKVEGNADWQHVISNWGNNSQQPKLTNKGNGIYELVIAPDINTFYSVLSNEKVLQLAFVFRSADGNKQTNDLFIDVAGLQIEITEPVQQSYIDQNQEITISVNSSLEASLKINIKNNTIAQTIGTNISTTYSFTQNGTYWIIAEATTDNSYDRDSVLIFVSENIVTKAKPESYKEGINYPNNTTAALVLWAPLKDSVFVIGDFNDWKPVKEYKMYRDRNYFWLEIQDLEPGTEYAFQYLIDGKIRIADPYAEKILDPWNDGQISSTVYQELKAYPSGKTNNVVSVLQSGQEKFNWEVTNFEIPEKEKMVIYELLIRDFTDDHTYKAVREKLDYLEDLNINVLELMPVNEFEGNSSWGYNPAFYFAPDKYYGPKNELKKLIDECHKRGIAVVIDMVLNHSYGQSPFVQMYMDNWTITEENPWYNQQHNFRNRDAQWGFDFNHESQVTKALIDSISSFWMSEYKVDGFRFDFTKGFSNTTYGSSSWGSDYDKARIINLKRMADEIWKHKADALVILEHLAVNNEEKELADYGFLLWGNMHGSYLEAARGDAGTSDFSWAIYDKRGWNNANLISYPESHDEERIMHEIKNTGSVNGDYNIKNEQTALERIELNALFHILLPGPKMIWQFGERGYDHSINSFGGRLSEKPPFWEYLDNTNRADLFTVFAKLNGLKQDFEEFSAGDFEYELRGNAKWFTYTLDDKIVGAVGNFDTKTKSLELTFPGPGKYYEFFSNDSIEITDLNLIFDMSPGEYRLYSSRNLNASNITTNIKDDYKEFNDISIYPNPAVNEINISSFDALTGVHIYSLTGKLIYQNNTVSGKSVKINIEEFTPGIYLVKVFQNEKISTKKVIVK